MTDEFKYEVSIIVPIYNAEDTIQRCINSLMVQTFPFEKMQIILINNNSEDTSIQICKGYAYSYDNIYLIQEVRQGVSYARNAGLECVMGKYVMYVDADDYIGKSAIENIYQFFEKHYDEIDLVTYYEKRMIDGKVCDEHIRYKSLTQTGIYDLEETPFALQVRLNICVKNLPVRFDTEIGFQEDQKYCCEILKDKLRLGYVKEANYFYEPLAGGLLHQNKSPMEYFEVSTRIFEDIFRSYEEVPKYFQALFLHDFVWKFRENRFWPYHYASKDLETAQNRIRALFSKVDTAIIMSYPNAQSYEALYWARIKGEYAVPYITSDGVYLLANGRKLYWRGDLELVLKKILIRKNRVYIRGFLKSPIFSYGCMPTFSYNKDGVSHKIEVTDCGAGYYKAKEKTNTFYGFEIKETMTSVTMTIRFALTIDDIPVPVVFYNTNTVAFSDTDQEYLTRDLLVKQDKDTLYFSKLSEREYNKAVERELQKVKEIDNKNTLQSALNTTDRRIWLYMDAASVTADNGYIQFRHDLEKEDGVERYYVITNLSADYPETGSSRFILAGSQRHRELFFMAEKILTSFMDDAVIWPLANIRKSFRGVCNAEIVYLQHGVLHAHMPWYYSKYTTMIDKVVISSAFEKMNFMNQYDYAERDLLCTGMPRLDLLEKGCGHTKKILFAPSWRSYLLTQTHGEVIERASDNDKLRSSAYYKGICRLIQSEEMQHFLRQTGCMLELKLHPEFHALYAEAKIFEGEGMVIAPNHVDLNKYDMLITDFSSLMYDFVYMEKPIICYMPDRNEFLCGLNHYRELDMPFEALSELYTEDASEVVDRLYRIQERQFRPRQDKLTDLTGFWEDIKSTRDKLYTELIDMDE